MKDSGIPWIGEIPVGWEVRKLKYICNIKRGASPRPIDDAKYFSENGERAWVRISDVSSATKYLYTTEQKLSKLGESCSVAINEDDFFISICASVGKPCISKIKACIHDGFVHLEKLDKKYNDYLFYLFETGLPYTGLGKMGTQLNLNSDTVGNIVIPVHDQIFNVVHYLNNKTQQIDATVEREKQHIEQLKQYRQSLISEIVTKGLDPSVSMRDSGIPWIGEIPEEWEVVKFKYLVRIKARLGWKGLKAEEYVERSNFGFLSTPNIKSKNIKYDEVNFITKERYNESPEIMLENGDVLLAKDGSTLGICNIVRNLPFKCTVNSSIAVLRTIEEDKLLPEYLCYYIHSESLQHVIREFKGGMGVPHLFQADIKNFFSVLPPLREQRAIADYLDRKTAQIDAVLAKKETLIAILLEYKKSLIYEAVTGKLDIEIKD